MQKVRGHKISNGKNMTNQPEKCNHEIGRRAIGGFADHEYIHPSGEQICFNCNKTLADIIKEAKREARGEDVLNIVNRNNYYGIQKRKCNNVRK